MQAAEKAALDGGGKAELDTQQCDEIQLAVFSSSPPRSQLNLDIASRVDNSIPDLQPIYLKPSRSAEWHLTREPHDANDHDSDQAHPADHSQTASHCADSAYEAPKDHDHSNPVDPKAKAHETRDQGSGCDDQEGEVEAERDDALGLVLPSLRRDTQHAGNGTKKQLRRDSSGKLRLFQLPASKMDDLTQNSPCSPTQENDDSAYAKHGFNVSKHGTSAHQESSVKHSLADSTAHTYGENETGHVHFDSYHPDDDESPDASYVPNLRFEPQEQQSYEPQTPAPAVNPFLHKGTVMNAGEMFGATQPSSIGRHILPSATSTRPSPDVYNGFTSPIKRMLSSPLGRRGEGPIETSPLQSSVRDLLRGQSESPSRSESVPESVTRKLGVQSFDSGYRLPPLEPRPYVSIQASQERRITSSPPTDGSDTENSDTNMNASRMMKRRILREKKVSKELSKVEVQLPRPSASVEVPSTGRKGRRRSIEEEYLTQCEGLDGRDTQSDEVIADSQAAAIIERSEPASHLNGDSSMHSGSSQDPGLPLKERSGNTRTPNELMIPETSPQHASSTQGQMVPIGEVASLSFNEETQDIDAPGFTQDNVYEGLVRASQSPEPSPTKPRRVRETCGISGPNKFDGQVDERPQNNSVEALPAVIGADSEEHAAVPRDRSSDDPLLPSSLMVMIYNEEQNLDALEEFLEEPVNSPSPTAEADDEEHPAGAIEAPLEDPLSVSSLTVGADNDQTMKAESKLLARQRSGLRSASEVRGPSTASCRSAPLKTYATPRKPARPASASPKLKPHSERSTRSRDLSTPSSTLTSLASSTPEMPTPNEEKTPAPDPVPSRAEEKETRKKKKILPPAAPKQSSRKSVLATQELVSRREPRRKSTMTGTRDSSADPLAGPGLVVEPINATGLFSNMLFAVSYGNEEQKKPIVQKIQKEGGRIVEGGFDMLFDSDQKKYLDLSPLAKKIGFVALITDCHSRKVKYVQALALGLPCLHGRWIEDCVKNRSIVDWTSYLLCAGESKKFLRTYHSRTLERYPATAAKFSETFEQRQKILEGQSLLIVTGKQAADKRKAYIFLARVLGHARAELVSDLSQARKRLAESEDGDWDVVHVDVTEKEAEKALFGSAVPGRRSKKRKRGPTVAEEPTPKRLRIISDQVVVQSLIVGKLLDSDMCE